MYGHTGGGHVGGGGHMPPIHHQPHQAHHQVHPADDWTSSDSRPHPNALAMRIRNPRTAATAAGVVLALLILLLVFL